MFLGGLILLFALSALGLQTDKRSDGTLSFISGLGIFLSCCWLGLLVFQSDAQDRRIQFFADRGIPAWKVWLTRQMVPMSLLICGATVLVFLLPGSISGGWLMLAAAFAIFLSSQWFSQMVRSPIVGVVIAPMIGAAVVFSAGFAAVELFAAPWTLALSGGIALLATLGLLAWGRSAALSPARSEQLVSGLLQNVYRAFDYRAEEQIYDALARSAEGDLLERIYLETRRGLELANQGGARAKVKQIELIALETEPGEDGGFLAHATWKVAGSVGHWGHIHQRVNQYRAELSVAPRDGLWKLVGLQILEEERL